MVINMGAKVIKPVGYDFPLKEFDDESFAIVLEQRTGLRVLGIRRHYRKGIMTIYFERKLNDKELEILKSLIENPPELFKYSLEPPDEEEGKKIVEKVIGIRPLRVFFDNEGKIRSVVFEKEIPSIKLTLLERLMKEKHLVLRKRKGRKIIK